MPNRPKRPCSFPGCPALTDGRYCPEHQSVMDARYNRNERDADSNKRYGRAWKKTREAFLSANPLCVVCERDGRLTPATLAHHKVKRTEGGTDDWGNMAALCQACHSRLHAGQGDYFRNPERVGGI